MSRVLCFKAQHAIVSFRLSWATSAIRFRLGIRRVDGCRDGFSALRMLESPLPPISRALSTVTLSERFSKHCVCIWVLLICIRLAVELPAGRHHLLNNICLVIAGLLRLNRSFVQETVFSDDRRTYMQEVPTDDEIVMWP